MHQTFLRRATLPVSVYGVCWSGSQKSRYARRKHPLYSYARGMHNLRPEKDENAEWSFCVLVILWVGRRQTGRVKAGRPPFTGLKLAESLD